MFGWFGRRAAPLYRAQVYRANPLRGQDRDGMWWRTRIVDADGSAVFNQADRPQPYEDALALAQSTGYPVVVNRDRPKSARRER